MCLEYSEKLLKNILVIYGALEKKKSKSLFIIKKDIRSFSASPY